MKRSAMFLLSEPKARFIGQSPTSFFMRVSALHFQNKEHFLRSALCFGGVTQVFASGEDTHALRLVSKLPDLRAGYVNWILLRRTHLAARVAVPKKKGYHVGILFSLEASPRFELGIRVLQTRALPLGYDALFICAITL